MDIIEIRRIIKEKGFEFYNSLPEQIKNIAGEFMYLNEEYVLNHQGNQQTQATISILSQGFTDNQKIMLLDALEHHRIRSHKKEGLLAWIFKRRVDFR